MTKSTNPWDNVRMRKGIMVGKLTDELIGTTYMFQDYKSDRAIVSSGTPLSEKSLKDIYSRKPRKR